MIDIKSHSNFILREIQFILNFPFTLKKKKNNNYSDLPELGIFEFFVFVSLLLH